MTQQGTESCGVIMKSFFYTCGATDMRFIKGVSVYMVYGLGYMFDDYLRSSGLMFVINM